MATRGGGEDASGRFFGFGGQALGFQNGLASFLALAQATTGESPEADVWAARLEMIALVAELSLTEPGLSLEHTITVADGVSAANPYLDQLPTATIDFAEQQRLVLENLLSVAYPDDATVTPEAIYGPEAVRIETALGIPFVSGADFETLVAFNDVLVRGKVLNRFENIDCRELNANEVICYEDAYWLEDGVFGPIPTVTRYGFSLDKLVFAEAFYPYIGGFPVTTTVAADP